MYDKVSTDLKFVEREQKVLAFWKENRIFEKSVELRKGAPAYTFLTVPPRLTASLISAMCSPGASRISSPGTAP